MLGLKKPLLTDEQSFVPRSLASIDGVLAYGILRHPAHRVALSRANDFSAYVSAHDRPLLAQSGRSATVDVGQVPKSKAIG